MMRIMVVDDDADIREVLALILDATGHRVETAADGVEALACLRRATTLPDVIIADLMMPRLDGEDLVRALQQDPRLAEIPVIIMSGHATAEQAAAKIGAAAALTKPIDLDQLTAAVRSVRPRPNVTNSGREDSGSTGYADP